MGFAVTDNRGQGATSKMRCVDVAALFAAAILQAIQRALLFRSIPKAYDASIDQESCLGNGRSGSTAVMTAWENFRANQRNLAGKKADPKLVCIDLQSYQTVQSCERQEIMNISGFIENDNSRFEAEIEAIEL